MPGPCRRGSPQLGAGQEASPSRRCTPWCRARRPRREGLVEPEVVPPLHGDHVAEPHVRHLVQQDRGDRLPLRRRSECAAEHEVRPGHAAPVLHRPAHVGHEHLVVLAPGGTAAEPLAEEGQARPRWLEELLGVAFENCFSDCRQRGRGRAVRSSRSSWNGPALTTATYVDSGRVGEAPRRPPSARSSTAGCTGLLTTVQARARSTVKACGALRSGWSKHAQARRASSGRRCPDVDELVAGRRCAGCRGPLPVSRRASRRRGFVVGRGRSAADATRAGTGGSRSDAVERGAADLAAQSTKVLAPGAGGTEGDGRGGLSTSPSNRPRRSTAMS